MTFQELLNESAKIGGLPKVEYHRSNIIHYGRITVIKDRADGGGFKGCAVRFRGFPYLNEERNYDIWFAEADGTDKRSKYMREIKISNQ